MTVKVPGAALLTAALVIGGQFRTKLGGGESVSLAIPRPAEAVLAAKTLELKLGPSQAPPNRLLQLTQFIQQDLSRQFEVTSNKPDATLQFSVIAYEPVKIGNQTSTEMRSINVGSASKPQFDNRSVPVVYELVHGSVTLGVAVTDPSGRVLDTFKQSDEVARRKELTVNGQASTQTETKEQSASDLSKERPKSLADVINLKPYLPGKKTAQAPHPVVETTDSIEMGMFQSLAAKVQRRYVPTTEPMEVALAVDPELKEGNKLAESGQWKEALNSWTKASLKKNPLDRTYNMAVAEEALAYADYARDNDLETFLPKFQHAMDLYTEALHGDPNEKYMRDSVERLQLAKVSIETARRMKVEQDTAAEKAIAEATEKARRKKLLEAALQDHRADSADEASFRTNVRTQLADATGEVPDARREQLIAFGQRLKLTELQSYRVVGQEIQRRSTIKLALEDYENTFRPLAADGKITTAERSQVRELAAKEGLNAADVKSIETKYHFSEAGAAPRPGKAVTHTASANPEQ